MATPRCFCPVVSWSSGSDAGRMEPPTPKQLLIIRAPERQAIVSNAAIDRKSTRLNSSHLVISYAVFCLKKKNTTEDCRPHAEHPCPSRRAPRHISTRPCALTSSACILSLYIVHTSSSAAARCDLQRTKCV